MKKLLIALMLLLIGAAFGADAPEAPRFRAMDVVLDTGDQPLAAYQVEITDATGRAKIVGIEGGAHAAYKEPPYYDPAAMAHSRVILAAFSLSKELPTGKTRVARVHLQITGGEPAFQTKLIVAAAPDGRRVPARVTFIAAGDSK